MHAPRPEPAPILDQMLDAAPEVLRRRPVLSLVVLCLLLWLPGFFSMPATDRDEARFAQATRQMLDTGDYVRIRFHDEERNKKPVGIHWAQAASVRAVEVLGLGNRTQIWPYRIPSLLGALLAVLATWHWGRGIVGRRAAFLAAAMLAGSLVLVAEAHIAKTDAALLASIAAAMGLFAQAYLRPLEFTARQAAGFWLALGVGILLKGPIAPMVPLLAGITLAVADRGAPWLRALRPAWGVPLMLAVAAPWLVAIGIATEGRFFSQAVGGDMLGKVGAGEEKHWGPPGLYLLLFGITAFPGSFLVFCALPSAWRNRLQPATRVLLAWVVPSWLLFEAVATKLPHYILPMVPALMLLGAAWALDPLRRLPPRWLRWLGLSALVGVAVGLGLLAAAAGWQLRRLVMPAALLAIPFGVVMAWLVLRLVRRGEWGQAGFAAVLLSVPLYAMVLQGVVPRLTPLWIAPRLAAVLQERAPLLPAERFGITSHSEPSVVFAIGAGLRFLRTGADAARFLAEQPGRVVAVGDRAEADFQREAAALGLRAEEIGTVGGFNYSRGRTVVLLLYRLPQP